MNIVCQSKNCNKKWTNILLLELKSTTFSLFLCENHVSNLEHELLPKWLKTCEKLRKNKFKKENKMQQNNKEIKNVQTETEQKEKITISFKKWIKTNYKKIILWTAVITALLLSIMSYYKTYNYKSYLGHDYTVYWGGAGTTIWAHETNDEHKIDLYFSVNQLLDYDKKWDGNYPLGYFDN